MSEYMWDITHLKKFWGKSTQTAIAIHRLSVKPGEKIAILGPSGSGKSTFLKVLATDIKEYQGQIDFFDHPLTAYSATELSQRRAVLPQSTEVSFDLPVELLVGLGRISKSNGDDQSIIQASLNVANATHLIHQKYHELSGGERARVHLARVFAQLWEVRDGLLLVDEPFAALDPSLQIALLKNLDQFVSSRNIAVMAVLHDVNHAVHFFDRALFIKKGYLVADELLSEIKKESFEALYDTRFLEFTNDSSQRYFMAH